MEFKRYYRTIEPGIWQGRVDDPNDRDSYRWHQVISKVDLLEPDFIGKIKDIHNFCFLGFCSDEGVKRNSGRVGTSLAPKIIRKEMANLPCRFSHDTKLFDAGDIYCTGGNMEQSQGNLSEAIKKILSLGLMPILLGGGHDISLGHFMGILQYLESKKNKKTPKIGIINFDAHFDLRPYKQGGSSGTMFSQIADICLEKNIPFSYFCLGIQQYGNTLSLFKKARELNSGYVLAKDISESTIPGINKKINDFIKKNDYVYLTICSDVFSSAFAPGVSAPQPFGLHPEVVLTLIKHILSWGKTLGIDIAEVSPRFDEDNRTAKLIAIVIFAIINTLTNSRSIEDELVKS